VAVVRKTDERFGKELVKMIVKVGSGGLFTIDLPVFAHDVLNRKQVRSDIMEEAVKLFRAASKEYLEMKITRRKVIVFDFQYNLDRRTCSDYQIEETNCNGNGVQDISFCGTPAVSFTYGVFTEESYVKSHGGEHKKFVYISGPMNTVSLHDDPKTVVYNENLERGIVELEQKLKTLIVGLHKLFEDPEKLHNSVQKLLGGF